MKKQLVLTTAMAATLAGCSGGNDWDDGVVADRDTAVCVDQEGRRIPDENCRNGRATGRAGSSFFWYYVGRGNRVPYYGDPVRDPSYGYKGSYFPAKGATYAQAPAGANMTRSTPVSRGGFGSSGKSFGGSWS
ncbi:MAG: hypothetical protein Q8R81_15075 [Novosphingobium sp.]|uniref:hypothetical protein n=1 Tax=Novosphingobium sp. TaxID=1874826 RepID=UPI002733F9AF|nr:hypothetical protein [Novosphingobium sp.]MDP3551701.1 hypothetical protein [Novosphingobium sp.]